MNTPGILSIVVLCLLLVLPGRVLPDGGAAEPLRIVVLGDSLTAGYGLKEADTFPTQLQKALNDTGNNVLVINAGVSGDTTAGGLSRLAWSLSGRPDLVIIQLGANDALRGIDPSQTSANLNAIILELKQAGVQVLLTGMRAPRNMGPDYYNKFDRIFPELAAEHGVPLYEFFLEGVAGRQDLNQADGIHPNRSGVEVIVKNILPFLRLNCPQIH